MKLKTARIVPSLAALIGVALLTAPASAQTVPATLSLTPLTTTAQVGQTVMFTVVLNGGSNIGSYDFNLFLGSPSLSYVGGFTFNAAAGFTSLPGSFLHGDNLEVSAGYPMNTSAGTQVNTTLGTFSVKYTGPVTTPVTTQITFGAPGLGDGQSAVYKLPVGSEGLTNELTTVTEASLITTPLASAPEPSAWVSLGVGAVLLGGAGWRARRRNTQSA